MKPGDMVGVKDGDKGITHWLYHSDFMNSSGNLIPTDIPFGSNDLGTVILTKKMVPGKHTQNYVKLLTSRGIGWCFQNYLVIL